MTSEKEKREDIEEVVALLNGLSPLQVEVLHSIIKRFAEDQVGELLRTDFLSKEQFEFFSMRLAAHHATSDNVLKKENFEHILVQSFVRTGIEAAKTESMTARGADMTVNGVTISLKTEAAKALKAGYIHISKLMEAAWIKQITTAEDIIPQIQSMVMPHFENYDRIFMLRAYADKERKGSIRYDLREIPKDVLMRIGDIRAEDFTPLTPTRTTNADVQLDGKTAFRFKLDGSDDKLTLTALDIDFCPLHAWWSMSPPG